MLWNGVLPTLPEPRAGAPTTRRFLERQHDPGQSQARFPGCSPMRSMTAASCGTRSQCARNPKTGKRVSRINPEASWQVKAVPQLRIVDTEVFAAVQIRLDERGHDTPPRRPPGRVTPLWATTLRLLRPGARAQRSRFQGPADLLHENAGRRRMHQHPGVPTEKGPPVIDVTGRLAVLMGADLFPQSRGDISGSGGPLHRVTHYGRCGILLLEARRLRARPAERGPPKAEVTGSNPVGRANKINKIGETARTENSDVANG
jgi:hypothetical protein